MRDDTALRAFRAMRADVEQFDDHAPVEPNGGSGLFSDRVPLFMKSYLVNWLRRYMSEHGDEVERALLLEQYPMMVLDGETGKVSKA